MIVWPREGVCPARNHTASQGRGQPQHATPHHAAPTEVMRGGAKRAARGRSGLGYQYLAQAAEGHIQGQREEVLHKLLESSGQLRALRLIQL